jgi:hypothetical protein
MTGIAEFGERVMGAVGKSTNIEFFPVMEKLGGNGPIMANALMGGGVGVRYIGSLGRPDVHPVFKDFALRSEAVSVSDPGYTTAVEFQDGKIMLGVMSGLDLITYDSIVATMGEGAFFDAFSRADLIALVNWTMIPNMTAIFSSLLERTFPALPPRDQRHFFFDLADPEKRSRGDLVTALRTIAQFQAHGSVTLGLNLKEAQQVAAALGLADTGVDEAGLKRMAATIRQALHLGTVVVHPRESAACATREDTWWVKGPFCERPLITTGAGDHFNAGFATGQLLGLSPQSCLTMGVTYSGYYVRSGRGPTLNDVDEFVRHS